jgi:hypothetical protein
MVPPVRDDRFSLPPFLPEIKLGEKEKGKKMKSMACGEW